MAVFHYLAVAVGLKELSGAGGDYNPRQMEPVIVMFLRRVLNDFPALMWSTLKEIPLNEGGEKAEVDYTKVLKGGLVSVYMLEARRQAASWLDQSVKGTAKTSAEPGQGFQITLHC